MDGKQEKGIRPADWEVAVASWNWDAAVERARPLVARWTQANIELYRELYIAREVLSRRGGAYRRIEGVPVKTWQDFCVEIGYTRQAVNARLRNFVPAELSEDGRDGFRADASPSRADREARSLARVAEFRSTGVRADGWTDDDDAMLRRVEAEERAAETAHAAVESLFRYHRRLKPRRDWFAEMTSRQKLREASRFRFSDKRIRDAQSRAGDSVARFLYAVEDLNDRAMAAAAIVARLKDVINDCIEEAALHADAEDAEDAEVIGGEP